MLLKCNLHETIHYSFQISFAFLFSTLASVFIVGAIVNGVVLLLLLCSTAAIFHFEVVSIVIY